ncbi:sodium channel protein Nach-like [Daktulosphaira vitifoliae]|uniref:sodium channel protein Nach-like n=1 Tax=Daktulosphaira vitifoliae TaxID=58002 RepID=UPI0021AAB42C|nr:sodium channel protein Nach-like [Daktulosphaira vitifoliae]
MKDIWREYCEISTIHGLRHVVQKDAKRWERVIWISLLTVASFTIFILLIYWWNIYINSPVQVVVDDPRYPLSKIDFPALTICPINKILYSKTKALSLSRYPNNSALRQKFLNSLTALSIMRFPFYSEPLNFIKNHSYITIPTDQIINIMKLLMPSISDVFFKCYWRGANINCTDLFRLQRTEEGFCYSFNSKTAERNENDSDKNPPFQMPNGSLMPLRNNVGGKMTGLEVILNDIENDSMPLDTRAKGFNVIVHTPEDFPDVSDNYKLYRNADRLTLLAVSVSRIIADESLYRVSESRRNCFMWNDNMISNNKITSHSNNKNNCKSTCRLQTIRNLCNCIPYFYNDNKKDDIDVCGVEHIKCLVRVDAIQRNTLAPTNETGFPKWSQPPHMNCTCPQPCSFLIYSTEVRSQLREYLDISQFNDDIGPTPVYLDFHFRDQFAISYIRSMKYSTQDLLVSVGGIASLFLGCSLVSLIEILYYLYKSIVYLRSKNIYKRQKKEKLVILTRRYHPYEFKRPLYKPPRHINSKTSMNQFNY